MPEVYPRTDPDAVDRPGGLRCRAWTSSPIGSRPRCARSGRGSAPRARSGTSRASSALHGHVGLADPSGGEAARSHELRLDHDGLLALRGPVVEAGVRASDWPHHVPPTARRPAIIRRRFSRAGAGFARESPVPGRSLDYLAVDVWGAWLAQTRHGLTPVMDRWAGITDSLIRRCVSLVPAQTVPRSGEPLSRFLARADPMLEEHEFFIRKAIGWVLRDAGKRQPDAVLAWLAPRADRANGVSMRRGGEVPPWPGATRAPDVGLS